MSHLYKYHKLPRFNTCTSDEIVHSLASRHSHAQMLPGTRSSFARRTSSATSARKSKRFAACQTTVETCCAFQTRRRVAVPEKSKTVRIRATVRESDSRRCGAIACRCHAPRSDPHPQSRPHLGLFDTQGPLRERGELRVVHRSSPAGHEPQDRARSR